MTQVKLGSVDIGRKSVPLSQPVSKLSMCHVHIAP